MIVTLPINQMTDNFDNFKSSKMDQSVTENNNFRLELEQSIQENSKSLSVDPAKASLLPKVGSGYEAIPNWVDPTYGFDPLNPRKPNMKEILEAISGLTVEELYQDPTSDWMELSSQASEILYGVTATVVEDTRNWGAIMESDNIVAAARVETGAMLKPQVKIKTSYNNETEIAEQLAILNDKNGKALRTLVGPPHAVEKTLLNFGATESSIPKNLTSQVNLNKFDKDLFHLLSEYKGNSRSLIEIGRQRSLDTFPKLLDNLELDLSEKL